MMDMQAINAINSAKARAMYLQPSPAKPAMQSMRPVSMHHDSVQFSGNGSRAGWFTAGLAALLLGVLGAAVPLSGPSPAQAQEKQEKSEKKIDELACHLKALKAIEDAKPSGGMSDTALAAKLTPLMVEYTKLLKTEKNIPLAELEKATTLTISNLYFNTSMDMKEAYEKGHGKFTDANLGMQSALIAHLTYYQPKSDQEATTKRNLIDRLYGDLLWNSAYSKNGEVVHKRAALMITCQSGSFTDLDAREIGYKKWIDALPSNNVAKAILTEAKADMTELLKLSEKLPEETDMDKRQHALIHMARVQQMLYKAAKLPDPGKDDTNPKIKADELKALRKWVDEEVNPKMAVMIPKMMVSFPKGKESDKKEAKEVVFSNEYGERAVLGQMVAQMVSYEPEGEDKAKKQLALWGYDPLFAKTRFQRMTHWVKDPKGDDDRKQIEVLNPQRYGKDVGPGTALLLDLARGVFGQDERAVALAYQNGSSKAFDDEPMRWAYFRRTMYTAHLAAAHILGTDNRGNELASVLLWGVDNAIKERRWKDQLGPNPVVWAEEAALIVGIQSTKPGDDEKYLKAKIAMVGQFMNGFKDEKGKEPPAWDFYRERYANYLADQAAKAKEITDDEKGRTTFIADKKTQEKIDLQVKQARKDFAAEFYWALPYHAKAHAVPALTAWNIAQEDWPEVLKPPAKKED